MLDIILACRNRPEYALEALKSLCNIDYCNYKISISDNSSTPLFDIKDLKKQFPHNYISYTYRGPNLNASEHHIEAILDSNEDLICLFHDDDIALPNFIKNRIDYFNDQNVIAVATNSYEMLNDKKSNKKLFNSKNTVCISSEEQFLKFYFSISHGNVPPYPGYIYRKAFVWKNIEFLNSTAMKYSDVIFLASLTKHGKIIWDINPTMYYRRHTNNDSNYEVFKDRIGLLGALKKILGSNHQIVTDYRFKLYAIWLPKTLFFKKNIHSIFKYKKQIKKFLYFYLANNSHRLLKKLLSRIR